MVLIKRSQEPAQPNMMSQILGLVGNWIMLSLSSILRGMGYVPYGTNRVYADIRRRIWGEAQAKLRPLYKQEVDKIVREYLRTFKPELANEPEVINAITNIITTVDQFIPILDTLAYPSGSYATLAENVLAMIRDMPSGDIEHDANLAFSIAKAYYDHFYHDADLSNKAFMERTWGMPAGELGTTAYYLYKMGLLKPRVQSINEQLQILEQFVPAVQAVRYFKREQGVDIPTADAIKNVIEINSLLAPGERNDPKALLKHVIAVTTYHDKMMQEIASPKPGALPSKEALEAHVKLLKQASQSWAANLFGALVYARNAGLVSPNSPAGIAAAEIASGKCPTIFRGRYLTSDLVFQLLVQSGARKDVAETLAYSPFLGRQMVGGLEHPVTLAVRSYQGEEARFLMEQATRQSLAYARSAGLSPQAMALKAKEAQLAVLDMYGYDKETVFQQLHDFDAQGVVTKHVNDMVKFYSTWAPDPSTIWQRLAVAARTSSNWTDFFARIFGFAPGEEAKHMPELSIPNAAPNIPNNNPPNIFQNFPGLSP